MDNPVKLAAFFKALLVGFVFLVLAGCGGSSSSGWGNDEIIEGINEDEFRGNFKALPGNWKGTANEGDFLNPKRSEEVVATFRLVENSWADGAIKGEIIFAQCIPKMDVTVTSRNNVIRIIGNDSGRSVELTIQPIGIAGNVDATNFSSFYTYTSNISGCPARSSGYLYMNRQ